MAIVTMAVKMSRVATGHLLGLHRLQVILLCRKELQACAVSGHDDPTSAVLPGRYGGDAFSQHIMALQKLVSVLALVHETSILAPLSSARTPHGLSRKRA